MLGLLRGGTFSPSSLVCIVIFVHKIIIIAQVILGNVDLTNGVRNALFRRGLKILQEVFESSYKKRNIVLA